MLRGVGQRLTLERESEGVEDADTSSSDGFDQGQPGATHEGPHTYCRKMIIEDEDAASL